MSVDNISEIKFCTKCVISNFRPSSVSETLNTGKDKTYIQFDENGVCSACRFAELMEQVNWEEREKDLVQLLDKYRRKDGYYDVIVPGSGGKDSAFVSHVLKNKYGMNPLTVTWSPHKYTDIGRENFYSWIDSGVDNILVTPNGKLHRLLTKMAFVNLCHPFQPFIIGQKIVGPLLASKFNIPLIMFGENPVIYGNDFKLNQPCMDESLYSYDKKEQLENIRLGGVSIPELQNRFGFNDGDFNLYKLLNRQYLHLKGVKVYYLGHYIKWNPQEMFYYASENTGFKPNIERTEGSYSKYSSIDDKIDPQHYYTTLIKFGLGRASYDAAQEIRNGIITREEGVMLVKKYDQEFPKKYFQEFLSYIDIDELQYWEIINKFRSLKLWELDVSNNWRLKYVVK